MKFSRDVRLFWRGSRRASLEFGDHQVIKTAFRQPPESAGLAFLRSEGSSLIGTDGGLPAGLEPFQPIVRLPALVGDGQDPNLRLIVLEEDGVAEATHHSFAHLCVKQRKALGPFGNTVCKLSDFLVKLGGQFRILLA